MICGSFFGGNFSDVVRLILDWRLYGDCGESLVIGISKVTWSRHYFENSLQMRRQGVANGFKINICSIR